MSLDQAQLTADRDELKYLVSDTAAAELARGIARWVAPYRYCNGSGRAPGASYSCATTVYFDTEQRELYRAAISERRHVKVRAREYYDAALESPHLALEPRTGEPRTVWIELKVRDGQRSTKRRVCVPKGEVERWFPAAESDRRALVGAGLADGDGAAVATELARLRVLLGGPLAPSCIVSYRRLSFQDDRAALRITLDHDVCAFAPRAKLWHEGEVLSRHVLGAPALEQGCCVLEIKSRGAWPAWIGELLLRFGAAPLPHGKFALASRAVHGPL